MSQPDFVDPGMLYPGMLEDYCVDPDGVWWPIPGPAALARRAQSPETSDPGVAPAGSPPRRDQADRAVAGPGTPPGFWLG